jgi:hypothetical protein
VKVSRREFVSTAGCAAAAASLCAIPSFEFAASDPAGRSVASCALLDLEANCALPESLAGMRAALGATHRRFTEIALKGAGPIVVVPAAGTVRAETFGVVAELVERGTIVLWESGAAFLNSDDFARQQALIVDHFGIAMERPIDVWSQSALRRANTGAKNESARGARATGHAQVPYVAYHWPREVHVRDFSRVIPVSAANGRAIGLWREIPVAWRKQIGAGTLIFVGSPVGPALLAGDSDAASLFGSLISV